MDHIALKGTNMDKTLGFDTVALQEAKTLLEQ